MPSAAAAEVATTMEISVSKSDLLKELTATQGVVERKTTIPILSNFLFEASAEKLLLTATDLDLSLRTSCVAKVKKEGSCTIPARKLYDYVKLLGDGEISIKLLEITGYRFAADAPIQKWSAWRAPTSPRCRRSQQNPRFNCLPRCCAI